VKKTSYDFVYSEKQANTIKQYVFCLESRRLTCVTYIIITI